MAPRSSATRRTTAPNDRLFELGVQGRKTGVTLRDTGVRDEHGMQPLEDIFSSPEKTTQFNANRPATPADGSSDSSGADMDIENTTAPDPAILMRAHGNMLKVPLPRSRSPIKTYLQSPARQNPHLNPVSSPIRGSIIGGQESSRPHSVAKRRLDFSMDAGSRSGSQSTASAAGKRGSGASASKRDGVRNGYSLHEEGGADEESILHGAQHYEDSREAEESMAMLNEGGADDAYDDDYYDPGDGDVELGEGSRTDGEVSEEEAPRSSRRNSRRGTAGRNAFMDEADEVDEPARKKRGRPAKSKPTSGEQAHPRAKRRRSSPDPEEVVSEPEPEPEAKKQRAGPNARGRKPTGKTASGSKSSAASRAAAQPPSKGRRGRVSTDAGDTSLAAVPRGPPLPKSRGLLINRRETPGDGITRTRSGRNSYKPLAFWRNEHVDYDRDQTMDDVFSSRSHPARFVLPTIKEVHRVDEPEPEQAKRRGRPARGGGGGGGGGRSSKRRRGKAADLDDMFDEPAEAWEEDPGTVQGDVVVWQPEYEYAPPGLDEEIEVAPEQLAVSGLAIETREIHNATFRFAKTLSLPFFGAGVVDLPPGAEKKPKNSRKMYMAFFVFAGRVSVTVNESSFRIGRGGMWFVPRGNTYSIENDYDEPARVFFSQGCEPIQRPVDDEGPE